MESNEPKYKPEAHMLVQDVHAGLDPRIYAATIFRSAKGDPVDNKLVSAAVTAQVDGEKVRFSVRAHAALCLNLSHAAYERLRSIRTEEIFEETPYGYAAVSGLPRLFGLFELIFVNIVFAYTALEAYANQVIPDTFVFARMRDDKRCEEHYNKEQIERQLSLDVKLSAVLPCITGIAFQKGTALWNEYASLRDIRDRIIHVKTVDLGLHEPTTQPFFRST